MGKHSLAVFSDSHLASRLNCYCNSAVVLMMRENAVALGCIVACVWCLFQRSGANAFGQGSPSRLSASDDMKAYLIATGEAAYLISTLNLYVDDLHFDYSIKLYMGHYYHSCVHPYYYLSLVTMKRPTRLICRSIDRLWIFNTQSTVLITWYNYIRAKCTNVPVDFHSDVFWCKTSWLSGFVGLLVRWVNFRMYCGGNWLC